jgi:hypothetical protein
VLIHGGDSKGFPERMTIDPDDGKVIGHAQA